MALGMVRRLAFIPFVAWAVLAQGCSSDPVGDDDSSDGCTKDVDCASGRICENKVCVNAPGTGGTGNPSSGLGGTSGTSGTGGASGTSGSGGTGSDAGGTSGTGGASGTAGSGGTSGSGGTAGSGGTGGTTAACSADDPASCPSEDEMTICVNGALQTSTCQNACEEILYFETGPCAEPDGCACGAPLDHDCYVDVSAFCSCADCTQVDPSGPIGVYIDCHEMNLAQEDRDFLDCVGPFFDETAETTDCTAAQAKCVPPASN